MNTRLKPMMKAIEFIITMRRRRFFSIDSSCSSSSVAPEISEMYPGTSGSTHGERNDTVPAIRAANGVRLAMLWVSVLYESRRDPPWLQKMYGYRTHL